MSWRETLERHLATKVVCALALICASASASATLGVRAAYQNAALSIDGVTSTGPNDVKQVQVDTPAGADVLAAYLYVADINGGGSSGDVTLNGTFLPQASGILLTPNANPANTRIFDVTSILAAAIEGGSGGVQNFSYSESGASDGAVLVVVYRTATTNGTAILLDGELAQAGDTTQLDFDTPYAGGDVVMSLASSFSYNGPQILTDQVTTVDVTTSSTALRRLTSCAGGNDDGNFVAANGELITAGGVGDLATNPNPTCTDGNQDDELYNLALGNSANSAPFLNSGDTFVKFTTKNPSFDDNVFLLGFTTTFKISSVDDTPIPDEPPTTVPEPTTLALLGLGFAGLAFRTRRRVR